MSLQSGQALAGQFATSNPSTGAAANADSTPTAVLVVNGVDNGAVVTITNPSTGVYKWTATAPTLAILDSVQLRVTATVATITGKKMLPVGEKDLAIDAAGEPTIGALAAQAKTDVQAALTAQGYTTTRAPKLDNLDVASSVLQSAINNLNNLSAMANVFGPLALEVPAAGSIAYPYMLVAKDAEGHLVDLTGTPTVTAANAAGTDRSANLSAVTHASTGVYTFTYTVAAAAAQEGIQLTANGTAADATARHAYLGLSVVAVDVATAVAAIKAKTDLLATNAADSPNQVQCQSDSANAYLFAQLAEGFSSNTQLNTGAILQMTTGTATNRSYLPSAIPNVNANVTQGGTAQAGTATTLTLTAGASAVNDTYKNQLLVIIAGPGAGQSRNVTGYDGSTKIATVDASWVTNPTSASTYELIAAPAGGGGSTKNVNIIDRNINVND